MSTDTVPGANPANLDVLAMGCWAEHKDGSLILVHSTEGNQVIYSVFELNKEPPLEYRDGMAQKDFEKFYSYDPKKPQGDKWIWHDKTPFPWSKVVQSIPPGSRPASAGGLISAADRVAQRLRLKGERINRPAPSAKAMKNNLEDAIRRIFG